MQVLLCAVQAAVYHGAVAQDRRVLLVAAASLSSLPTLLLLPLPLRVRAVTHELEVHFAHVRK